MEDYFDRISKIPDSELNKAIKKIRDTYSIKPCAPFYQYEFGFYCNERWAREGHIKSDGFMPDFTNNSDYMRELFTFDEVGLYPIFGLGWTEAEFVPPFEEKVLEDRGKYEVVQDVAGRKVLCFKGRRSGFMPEFLNHPVHDEISWEENCKWRLDPHSPYRQGMIDYISQQVEFCHNRSMFISQRLIGGYMFLRSLLGPEGVLYTFYDNPKLIHECMRTWFELADYTIAQYQKIATLDEVFISEDICYNKASLISHDMIREFLFPYYQQLISNVKSRQIDKTRHLYFQVDTDGRATDVIPLYRELGMDVMSPFEVASGCDVVEIGKQYPELVIMGGIDKRVLAKSKDDIDRYLDNLLPQMYKRGGYVPTCDHGVPEEVSFENYMHFRKRLLEYNE